MGLQDTLDYSREVKNLRYEFVLIILGLLPLIFTLWLYVLHAEVFDSLIKNNLERKMFTNCL